jgi:hypothetical protein
MIDTPSDAAVHPRQGKAWSADEDRQLYDGFVSGTPVAVLASVHQRSAGGIRSRLGRLGLIDQNGEVVDPAPPFAAVVTRRSATAEAHPSEAEHETVHSVFSVKTSDGWVIDIKSNRPLTRPLLDRLTTMLDGVVSGEDER